MNTLTATKATTRHRLANPHGWVLSYEPQGETVTLRSYYRGDAVGQTVMPRPEARQHYATQLRSGFVAPEAF